MTTPALSPSMLASSNTDELQESRLQIWEAGVSARDVGGVLAATAKVLRSLLPFSSLSLVWFEDRQAQVFGLNITGRETCAESRVVHSLEYAYRPLFRRQRLKYDFSDMERRLRSGKPFTCPDLLAKSSWYEHEFQLAAAGVRAYTSVPLLFGAKIVGSAIFGRAKPTGFTAHELLSLRDLSPAIAGVIANVLQNKKVTDRCVQLENENLELRSQAAKVAAVAARDARSNITFSADDFKFLRERMDGAEASGFQASLQSTDISTRLKAEERRLIETTLRATRGRVSGPGGAAVRLGLRASTLEFRIHRLGIDKFQYRQRRP